MNTARSLLCVAALLLAAAPSVAGETDTVLVLHTNDVHSYLSPHDGGKGGLARIGGYVDSVRAKRGDVLLLDAGDGVTGTPVSSIFLGRPVFHVMNVVGYDAMALGNHEFDHGWRRIEDYRRIAAFPILAANVRGPKDRLLGDAEYRVFDVDGVRVGVIGLVTPTTPDITASGATEGCTFEPGVVAVRRLLPDVERKSDLVVVLSHLGHEADRKLAAGVAGIDLIVGGHTHTVLSKPVAVGRTLIVQAGANGERIGRLELTVDMETGTVVRHEGALVAVDGSLPESAKVSAEVSAWEDRVRKTVEEVIGRADRAYGKAELRGAIEKVYRELLSADLGYQNAGGVRSELAAGEIRVRHIWKILPFENTLVTLRIRGANLPGWARKKLGTVQPGRIYTVATNSYVAGHADRYFPKGVEGSVPSGRRMRDAVIAWIRKRGGL